MTVDYEIIFEDDNWAVNDKQGNYKINLDDRLLELSVNTIRFLQTISNQKEYDVIRYQLSKSVTSIGANYQESQACTDKEFYNKISICLREARETRYWFQILNKLTLGDEEKREVLIKESEEITKIIGAIRSKVYHKLNNK
ncbi:MAG TPA: four helix bundle protein [bacterium]|nr:four helix bundle protein [bacterium]